MSTERKPAGTATTRTKAGPTKAAPPKAAPPKSSPSRAPKTDAAHTSAQPPNAAPPSEQTTTERAEEVFDQIGQRIGVFTLVARDRLIRATARAREEAEDMWAEAQHLRGRK